MESGSTAVMPSVVGPGSPIASAGPPLPPPSVRSLAATSVMSSAAGSISLPSPIGNTTTAMMMPLKLDKPVYSSPPPAPSNPENNQCKMIDYRGAKVAAFQVDGRELICLPQAFELFLKHLVGGLHTVYTKLKRLDITPIVCNVEQVRVLRGLGAIQPGVNRCKLISPKEFDVLYDDCTNSSARPGRPPKRSPSVTANPDTLDKLKKSRLDNGEYAYAPNKFLGNFGPPFVDPKKSPLFGNGYHYPPHLANLPMPFMPLGHPMMSMAMANHIGMRPDGSVIRDRAAAEHELASPGSKDSRYDDNLGHMESNNNKPMDKPLNLETKERRVSITDKDSGMSTPSEMSNGQLDLSMKGPNHHNHLHDDVDDESDGDKSDDDDSIIEPGPRATPGGDAGDKLGAVPVPGAPLHFPQLNADVSAISSLETLLMNIQGLLKVAAENARHRERQINYEKAELKVELMRERELRESTEKQLVLEQRDKLVLTKRLKKEKKARKRLQEQVEQIDPKTQQGGGVGSSGSGRDSPLQDKDSDSDQMPVPHPPKPSSVDNLRRLNESLGQDLERDRNNPASDERRITDARSGLQNLMDTFLPPPTKCSSVNGYNVHPPVIKQAAESV